MSGCSSRLSCPFGPLTVTRGGSICTSTPFGRMMGARPIRDITGLLPDVAEDLAADVGPTGLRGGHEPPRCRNDRDAEAAQYARHVLALDVDAQARFADALQAGHDRFALAAVAELDLDLPLLLLRHLEI